MCEGSPAVLRCFPSTFSLTKTNNSTKRLTSRSLAGLALAVSLVTALVALALSLGVKAVVRVRRLVPDVGIDTDQLATVDGRHALHGDGARAVAAAVAARAVDFAVVLGVKVLDVDRAAAVVLDHFVGGVEGAAADDVGRPVAFDADGVLADVFEPEVFEGAGAWDGGLVLVVNGCWLRIGGLVGR